MSMKYGFKSCQHFLKESEKYKLGFLPTEQSHPSTWELSHLAKADVRKGIDVLKQIDLHTLKILNSKLKDLEKLRQKIELTFKNAGRVFIAGCGATGRLSLLAEKIFNDIHPKQRGQVISFMAGGDIALVQSVEGFEDFPDYGARQLTDLGFSSKDLLICSTEGGETPFVIGAAQKGLEISNQPVYFLFCNPEQLLKDNIDRSKEILTAPNLVPIELFVGPMGVAGSTRMQASTILQAFITMALCLDKEEVPKQLSEFIHFFSKLDLTDLADFIEQESQIYENSERLTYHVDSRVALGVFTDTTERAPTFSLKAFDHPELKTPPLSLSYVCIDSAQNAEDAWTHLLSRAPRPLCWTDTHLTKRLSKEYLNQFDFSSHEIDSRNGISPSQNEFKVSLNSDGSLILCLNTSLKKTFQLNKLHPLFQQIILKLILNTHSTLVMGRIGRYQNNLMTWVSPSNGKLVDRTLRYVDRILTKNHNLKLSYETLAKFLFESTFEPNKSVVLQLVDNLAQAKN